MSILQRSIASISSPGTASPAVTRRARSSTCPATRTRACSAACSRSLPPLEASDAKLKALADAMLDPDPASAARGQPQYSRRLHLPRPVRRSRHHARPDVARREGQGPARHRELPHAEPRSRRRLRPRAGRQPAPLRAQPGRTPASTVPKLLIGKNINVGFGGVTGDFRNDLPRSPEGFALIGDHRNDENLLVAQTHLAFLKFHNKVCDLLAGSAEPAGRHLRRGAPDRDLALPVDGAARLRRAPDRAGIVAKILHDGRKFYRFKKTPYMPVEFSAAAYRLGHSMVRQTYSHNRVFQADRLRPALRVHRPVGQIIGDLAPNPPTGPLPVPVLPSNWIIDWRRFYDLGTPAGTPGFCFNHARKLDPFLVQGAAHAARRRRQSRLPQPEARRQPRAALRPGRGEGA